MSGQPYALQSLPAIINFSGGRSSAFMLHHILEHDDGRLHAKPCRRVAVALIGRAPKGHTRQCG